jgi:hypothetical protein
MSSAFMIFIIWLALAFVASRFFGIRRLWARLTLLCAAPWIVMVAYVTQGWFPATLVALSVPTVFGSELLMVLRSANALLIERRVRRGTRDFQAADR